MDVVSIAVIFGIMILICLLPVDDLVDKAVEWLLSERRKAK